MGREGGAPRLLAEHIDSNALKEVYEGRMTLSMVDDWKKIANERATVIESVDCSVVESAEVIQIEMSNLLHRIQLKVEEEVAEGVDGRP